MIILLGTGIVLLGRTTAGGPGPGSWNAEALAGLLGVLGLALLVGGGLVAANCGGRPMAGDLVGRGCDRRD